MGLPNYFYKPNKHPFLYASLLHHTLLVEVIYTLVIEKKNELSSGVTSPCYINLQLTGLINLKYKLSVIKQMMTFIFLKFIDTYDTEGNDMTTRGKVCLWNY